MCVRSPLVNVCRINDTLFGWLDETTSKTIGPRPPLPQRPLPPSRSDGMIVIMWVDFLMFAASRPTLFLLFCHVCSMIDATLRLVAAVGREVLWSSSSTDRWTDTHARVRSEECFLLFFFPFSPLGSLFLLFEAAS